MLSAGATHAVRTELAGSGPGWVDVVGVGDERYLDDTLKTVEQTKMKDPNRSYSFNSSTLRVIQHALRSGRSRDDAARKMGPLQDGRVVAWEIRRMANRSVQLVRAACRSDYLEREPAVFMSAP